MSDTPDPKEGHAAEELASEFQNLGDNLKKIIIGAWESDRRKNLQQEIEEGLAEVGSSLRQTANEIQESEASQRFQAEAEDLRNRVRSGEVEQKVRSDLQTLLHKLNLELEKVVPAPPPDEESGEEGAEDE